MKPRNLKLDRIIDKQFKLYEGEAKDKMDEIFSLGFDPAGAVAKVDPNDEAGVERLFQKFFGNILINPKMGAIGRAAKTTPIEVKYDILQQYAQGGGGSLRLADQNTVRFVPKEVKDAAVHSKFRHGGTQGKTQLGGV